MLGSALEFVFQPPVPIHVRFQVLVHTRLPIQQYKFLHPTHTFLNAQLCFLE